MGDAFNNGRMTLDTKPYSTYPDPNNRKTPHQLATERNLIGCWISTGRPNTAASRRIAAGAQTHNTETGIDPHPWTAVDGQCTRCPLPQRHRIHITPPTNTEHDQRVLGERHAA